MNIIKLTHRDITYYINVSKTIHIESYYEINFADEKYAIDIVLSHDVIKLRYNNEKCRDNVLNNILDSCDSISRCDSCGVGRCRCWGSCRALS